MELIESLIESLFLSLKAEGYSIEELSILVEKSREDCFLRSHVLTNRQLAKDRERFVLCHNSGLMSGETPKPVHLEIICPTERTGRVLGTKRSNLDRIKAATTAEVVMERCTGYCIFKASAVEEPAGFSPILRAAIELFPPCVAPVENSFVIYIRLTGNQNNIDMQGVVTGARVTVNTNEANDDEHFVKIYGAWQEVKAAFVLIMDLIRTDFFL